MRNLKRYLSIALIVAMLFSSAISATAAGEDPISEPEVTPAGLNYDQYTPLKNVYKDYFMIGTVGALTNTRSDLIAYHFNSYTPENEMKPESMQRDKGMFTFNTLDNLLSNVTALSDDIKLIGHTLAWHSQTPNWMWDAPNLDREVAEANLNAHIDRVLSEYGEELYSMDVVNEAIGTANPSDYRVSLNKGEGWSLALGSDWVETAFLEAAKVVDENGWDTRLYYNDFGLNGAAKAQTVYEMVKDINERNAETRPNGKPLIEGIGMQGHYNNSTKPEDVEASIKLFATLPGVSISFTELDIEWLNMGSLTHEQAVAQGQKYAQLFQIFKKYAAGSANNTGNPKVIERVTIWGSNDGDSWKNAGFPLLFNAPSGTDITAKEALVAVLNPDAYLKENPVVDDQLPEPKKLIDGVYVYDTSKGDSWSGANIILGNNANKWPWSTAGTDGKVALTPEKDATYRITVNYTSMGTNSIRVRWLKDESGGGYTNEDSNFVSKAPYNTNLKPDDMATMIPAYFNSDMSTGNSYTLVTEIKLDGSQPAGGLIGNIAIRGGSGGNSFSINEIKVEKIGAAGNVDKLLVNWPDGLPKAGTEGVHNYSTTDGDSWSGANIILGNNAKQWPWSTAGADGKVAFNPEKEATYRVAVNYTAMGTNAIRVRWIKDESGGGYTKQDSETVNNNPYSANQVATAIPAYFNSGMVNAGTYNLITEIKLDGSQPTDGLIGNIAIRGGAGGNSFLINSIKVEKIGTGGTPDKLLVNWPEGIDELEPEHEEPVIVIPPAGQTYDKYSPLKDVYQDYFTMGIFGAGENNALIHNFASYAPGNEMKPESTQNLKGTFTYNSADNAFNNLASKNPKMMFYGHTLAWHSQSPTWMWDAPPARYDQPGTFDRDTAQANLNDHIEKVLEHFGGRLEGVDVVNEAVGTSNPNDWRASLAKGEGWYMALGSEWVELAFLKAAKVVDENGWDTKLIYNDFGLDSPNKARVVYEMVKDINERYSDVRPNGKPLIEVIGMQAHYNLTTSVQNVEDSIKLFATLPGVSINITEMDIGTPPIGVLTSENENNQAMKFAELFQIYKKYAAGSANKTDNPKVIERVSICGVRDATSGWRAGEFALLFDSNGFAKQALVAVLDPDAYLESHEYIEPETGPELPPVDGIHLYDAGKGDAWSGANIILGNDADKWPYSTAGSDGKVAFIPEKDATYRLSFNYTAKGTTSIRVRWIKDSENGNYTDADGAIVNNNPYSANQVATAIPAYFNSGMVNSGSYTLTTEIKLDGSQSANGLIGNIGIRGGGGGNAFEINWIKVTKIGTGGMDDELLVSWPNTSQEVTKHKIDATAGAGGTITPSGNIEVAAGTSQIFTIAPNANYEIADVVVNGISVGAVSAYTFNNVTSDQSIVATFRSQATAPAAPTNVSAQAKSTSAIEINWTALDNVTGYNVFRSASANGNYSKVNTLLITETKFQNSGLSASTTYYYKVAAVNNAGESVLSAPVHATTYRVNTGPITPPTTPVDETTDELKAEVDSSGNAIAPVKAKHVKKALSEAKDGTMKLEVLGVENAKLVTISLPKDQVNVAKEAGIERIEISFGLTSVLLPVSLFEGAAGNANMELIIATVDNSTLSDAARAFVGSNTVYDINLWIGGQKITNFGQGQQVKVELPYMLKPGENPSQVVIYYLSDDGSLEIIKNSHYNKDAGTVAFNAKHFSKYAAIANSVKFSDTKAIAWASDSIDGLAARGIVRGVTKDSFAPSNSVTRAEFIQMLVLTLDLTQANATSTFWDVKQDAWYYSSVASAQQLGIVSGLTDGSFGVSNNITRQEMATMAYRAIQKAGITLNKEQGAATFNDAQDIASFAKEAVSAMNKAGIINGVGNGKFDPNGTATRAQAAVILYQLLMNTL